MNWLRPSSNKKIQALLISPHERGNIVSNDAVFPFPSLTLPLLASAFPGHYQVRLKDEKISRITGKEKADIIFITSLTSTAHRAYRLADIFKKRGIPVVIGGVHATMLPREAQAHATSVVMGEAEQTISRLLSDFERGDLAPIYQNTEAPELTTALNPALSLLSWRHRFFLSPIQTSRGCPYDCNFCSVPKMSGRTLRLKPLNVIEKELVFLRRFRSRKLFVVDDNFTLNRDRSLELMALFRKFGFRWMTFSNLSISEDEEYLRAMAANGCISLFIGFESLHFQKHLQKNNAYSTPDAMAHAVDRIHKYGIGIQGSFIFGFDSDTSAVFDKTVSFIQDSEIELPNICILTPFPGTPLFDELESQGRILHKDWSAYDMNHVVFRPANMSSEELQQGYAWALKYLASPTSIIARIKKKSAARAYFLTANFSLHRSQTRLALSLWNPSLQTLMQEKGLCHC